MNRIFYIVLLSLLMVTAASGIAFLIYPDFETDSLGGVAVSAGGPLDADRPTDEQRTAGGEPREPREPGEPREPREVHESGGNETYEGHRAGESAGGEAHEGDEGYRNGGAGPHLYLILDDGGHSVDQLRWFTDFPGVFTVAVLPNLDYSSEVARMAVALGHELMLHQPMEALAGNDPGPGAVYTSQPDYQIKRTVRRNLAQLPEAVGMNNHMGSKVTEDRRAMAAVVAVAANRKLFFLDSRTTAGSVADSVAMEAGLPGLRRDVFLDNIRTESAISGQLDVALDMARKKGFVVMIGHVTSLELARVLVSRYDEITAAGFEFGPISDLVDLFAGEEERIAHEGPGN